MVYVDDLALILIQEVCLCVCVTFLHTFFFILFFLHFLKFKSCVALFQWQTHRHPFQMGKPMVIYRFDH
jgi:hypothetical protein